MSIHRYDANEMGTIFVGEMFRALALSSQRRRKTAFSKLSRALPGEQAKTINTIALGLSRAGSLQIIVDFKETLK